MFDQSPVRLTIDGIRQIIGKSSIPGQHFVLQVLSITNNYLGEHYTELSDGFCKVKCQLKNDIVPQIQAQKLVHNSVIRFYLNECQVVDDNSSNPSIILNKCEIFKSNLNRTIGAPMHFNLYRQKGYQNPQGSNLIEDGPKAYRIKDIINNTRMKNPVLRARVIKLPKNIKLACLNFQLQDDEGTVIQACCFDGADNLYRQLSEGKQYLISNFKYQKNSKTGADQLKFRADFKFEPLFVEEKQIKRKQSKQDLLSEKSKNLNSEPQQPIEEKFYTKIQLIDIVRSNKSGEKFFTIVGRVVWLRQFQKFKKINVQDQNGAQIDVIIWKEIQDKVLMDKVFKFENLRLKKDQKSEELTEIRYIQLQSSNRTCITAFGQQEFQQLTKSSKLPKKNQRRKNADMPTRYQNTKKLPENVKLLTGIEEVFKKSYDQNPEYLFVECHLSIRLKSLRFNDDGDFLNFFSFYCKPCTKNSQVNLSDNNVVFCNVCKKNDIKIKWNLRIRVCDYLNELPCSLQDETTTRILNKEPREGYLLYMKSKEQFEELLRKINFETRVCKLQIKKVKDKVYYNILEIFAKDTQFVLRNELNQFKQMMVEKQKKRMRKNKQNKGTSKLNTIEQEGKIEQEDS